MPEALDDVVRRSRPDSDASGRPLITPPGTLRTSLGGAPNRAAQPACSGPSSVAGCASPASHVGASGHPPPRGCLAGYAATDLGGSPGSTSRTPRGGSCTV